MNIVVDRSDLRKVEKMLGAYQPDWTDVMKRTGAAGLSWIGRNFQSEGAMAYRGNKWTPLSEVTIQRRRKSSAGGQVKILQDTGELKQSATFELTTFPTVGGRLGFTSQKAPIHQQGGETTIGSSPFSVTIPQRRILPSDKQAINMMTRALIWTIRRDLAKAGYAGPVFGSLPPA